MTTAISPELIAAYREARYCVHADDGTFELSVDARSADLARIFEDSGCAEAVFITAWNPYSQPRSRADNEAANARLVELLTPIARTLLPSEAGDPSGEDAVEPGFLALGLGREHGRALGDEFEQNAILYIGADAVPRLELLR